jgi:predicted aspartyl protease
LHEVDKVAGTFTTKLKVWNPADPSRTAEVEVWVDTGAAYTWVSRARLEPLGVQTVRRLHFRTIEGRTVERELAPVFVSTDGYMGGDTVVLAEPGELEVVGAHTLESLGLTVDPVQRKLVPIVIALALAVTGEEDG